MAVQTFYTLNQKEIRSQSVLVHTYRVILEKHLHYTHVYTYVQCICLAQNIERNSSAKFRQFYSIERSSFTTRRVHYNVLKSSILISDPWILVI